MGTIAIDLGSDVDHCGILTAIVQVVKRDEFGDTGLEQRSLACTGQQLIPGPFYMSPVRTLNNCHRALHWDGPGISGTGSRLYR